MWHVEGRSSREDRSVLSLPQLDPSGLSSHVLQRGTDSHPRRSGAKARCGIVVQANNPRGARNLTKGRKRQEGFVMAIRRLSLGFRAHEARRALCFLPYSRNEQRRSSGRGQVSGDIHQG